MSLVPSAPLLAALLTPGLLYQDAAPPLDTPAPAGDPTETTTPPSPEAAQILRLAPTGGERRTADRADLDEAAKTITEFTNAFRKKNDLKPVTRNETLAKAAKKFGEYLAKESVFGHRAGGTTPSQRVEAVGYEYCSVRENLAYHFDTFGFSAKKLAKASVDGWINSPGHRANLLAEDVNETGVGVVQDKESGRYFSVQLFALPESAAVTFEVENRTEAPQTYRVRDREYTLPPRYVQTHTSCTAGPVSVRLGPAPKADASQPGAVEPNADEPNADADETATEDPKEDAEVLKLSAGQVLILRPGADGAVNPEVWSPPEEEANGPVEQPAVPTAPAAPPAGG